MIVECPCCGELFDPDNAETKGQPEFFVSFGGRVEIFANVICPACESILDVRDSGDVEWDTEDPDIDIIEDNADHIYEEATEKPKTSVKPSCEFCPHSRESFDPRGCGPNYGCTKEFCVYTGTRKNYPSWDPHGLCKDSY